MSDEITPALTPDEWARGVAVGGWYVRTERGVGYDAHDPNLSFLIDKGDGHGVAALLLYEQPFGFTQAHVDALRAAVRDPDLTIGTYSLLGEVLDRVAALLPPPPS